MPTKEEVQEMKDAIEALTARADANDVVVSKLVETVMQQAQLLSDFASIADKSAIPPEYIGKLKHIVDRFHGGPDAT